MGIRTKPQLPDFGRMGADHALLDIAGWTFRSANVHRFFAAVKKAERRKARHGIRVVPEPRNRHDPNAIAVHGFADVRSWFRTKRMQFRLGYVPAEIAAELQDDLLSRGVPISAELYSLYRRDDYHEIRIVILAPPGFSVKARQKR